MTRRSWDPSVHREPHLRGEGFRPDPSEAKASAGRARRRPPTEEELADQSVYDEPGFSPALAGPVPQDRPTYRRWLEHGRARVSAGRSWALTLALALAAGPLAILGGFRGSDGTAFGVLALVVFGPVTEEIMKVAAALYAVEKRPFFFRSSAQILLTVVAGAVTFAMVENALYLNVYMPEPSPAMVAWRWTVCVTLHVGCTTIAGLGLMRIWRDVWARMARPRLALGSPYLLTAIAIHGAYNALVLFLSVTVLRS